jgi:hypothetical protein
MGRMGLKHNRNRRVNTQKSAEELDLERMKGVTIFLIIKTHPSVIHLRILRSPPSLQIAAFTYYF